MIKEENNMKQTLKRTSIALVVGTVFSQGAIDVIAQHGLKDMGVNASNLGVINQAQAQEVVSTLPVNFSKIVHAPNIFTVPGTNKVFIDFDNAADALVGEPQISPAIENNPLIENIETRKLGSTVRVSLNSRVPVNVTYNKVDNSFVFTFVKSASFVNAGEVGAQTNVVRNISSTESNKSTMQTYTAQNDRQKIIDHVNDVVSREKTSNDVEITPVAKTTITTNAPISNTLTPISAPVSDTSNVTGLELDHLNLKKDHDRVAKLTLDLNAKDITPSITKSGNLLIIDLKGVKIPSELQKTLSTKSIDTVVQSMDVAMHDNNGRIVLEQNDNWDYSVYQMDKRLVIEIKPTNGDKNNDRSAYHGKPFSMQFQNMDVRSVLQVIADFSGLNILASDSVTGSMTIRLKDVPWDQALDLILESKNLQKVKQGNVIWIATRQEIAEKNKNQLELNAQAAELEPLKLEFFQLNHYKASELKDVLEGKTGNSSSSASSSSSTDKSKGLGLLSKRGSIGLDIRNNTLFIQDTESKLAEVSRLINRLDQPTRQVLIDAKLVIATDKFERDLGAQFGFGVSKSKGNTSIGIGNTYSDSQTLASGGSVASTGSSAFSLPVTGGGSLGFTILNAATGNMLSLELSALEEKNLGKVVSNPRLLTADNKKAIIRQGTEIPYVTPATSSAPATVSFKDAVLELDVVPQVSANGRVSMDLDITKDTVGQLVNVQGGGQVPSIDTRKITTQVTVDNGQTVVLGGIYEVTSADDLSKVPFFGDIPFVGNLFKNTSKTNQKVELLIFITPHVINDADLDSINTDQQSSDEFDFSKK